MAVSAEGELRFEPLFAAPRFTSKTSALRTSPSGIPRGTAADASPLLQLIGVGIVTGDATGGNAVVTLTFPQNFAYILRAVAILQGVTSTQGALLRYSTGIVLGGATETYHAMQEAVQEPANTATNWTWKPPQFLALASKGVSPVVTATFTNADTIIFKVSCRALAWDLTILRDVPLVELAAFLAS